MASADVEFYVDKSDGAREVVKVGDTPFETLGDAIAARFLMNKLMEIDPASTLNTNRQFVLDNWPYINPKV